MYSTKYKPRIIAIEWPDRDIPPPALARMYIEMAGRCGQLLETLQTIRDDPQTPEWIKQKTNEAING